MEAVDRYAYGYALLVLVGVIVLGAGYLFSPDLLEVGDTAVNSLQIREAEAGRQLVGPYSRYRFNHPGPISFYYLAFAGKLVPGVPTHLGRYNIAQLVLNCGLLALLLRLAGRLAKDAADPPLLGLAVLFTVLPLAIVDFHPLWEIWGPLIIILPVTLFVFCAARLAAGRLELAPLAALTAVLAVHNHMSAGAVVAPLGLLAGGLGLVRRARSGSGRLDGRAWLYLTAAVGILLVTSLPPLIEQFTTEDGNLGKLYRLFTLSGGARHGLLESVRVVWWAVAFPPTANLGAPFGGLDPLNGLYQAIVALILGWTTWRQWRRSEEPNRLLIEAVLLALVLTVVWARTVREDLGGQLWLFHFVSGLAGFLYFWLLRELLALARRAGRALTGPAGTWTVILLAGIGGLLLIGKFSLPAPDPVPDFDRLIREADLPTDRPVYLFLDNASDDHGQWPSLVITGLKLERQGYKIRVSDRWATMFGPHRCERRERHAPNLIFSWRDARAAFGEPVRTDRFQAYIVRNRELSEAEIRFDLAASGLLPLEAGRTYACDDPNLGLIGWYGVNPNRRFRWSQGEQCSLVFRLDPEHGRQERVILTLKVGALGRQRIPVVVNGHPLQELRIEGFAAVEVPLAIPAAWLAPEGLNRLDFELPDARKPDPADKRTLALRLESLSLDTSP